MDNQITSTINTLNICSRCFNHEVNSWINENWSVLNEETKKAIHEELKTIKIKEGKCLVCEDAIVSDGTAEKIFDVLKANKVSPKTRSEFKKFFLSE